METFHNSVREKLNSLLPRNRRFGLSHCIFSFNLQRKYRFFCCFLWKEVQSVYLSPVKIKSKTDTLWQARFKLLHHGRRAGKEKKKSQMWVVSGETTLRDRSCSSWGKQSCYKAEMSSSYIPLIKKLSNFPRALTVTIFFTAKLTNRGIGKGISDAGKGFKRNDICVL